MPALSIRADRILREFLSRVRAVSAATLTAREFPDSKNGPRLTRRTMAQLIDAGFAREHWCPLYPMPPVATEPLFDWRSGDPVDRFNKDGLEYATKTRFSAKAKRSVVYTATEKTTAIYGGRGGRLNRLQVNHDVHVASVLAHLLIHKPDSAKGFVAEDSLRWHRNSKRPDAVIYDQNFQPVEVHESGGCGYPARRIQEHFDWILTWAETTDLHYFFW